MKDGSISTWLQRIIVVVETKFERRMPEKRPVRKLDACVKNYDRSHLEK